MKVNVVMDSASRSVGGLFEAERRLWQSLSDLDVAVSVFALADEFSACDVSGWLPIMPENFVVAMPAALGFSRQLRARLLAEPADLLYRAGLWKWPSRNALEWGHQHKKPEIIAPHGMLDPWAVRNSAWKKRLALLVYERKHLANAACIRALCEAEAKAIRAFGLKNPIAIIPNGIDLPELRTPNSELRTPLREGLIEPGRKVLLFLSRIHPKKGLVNLLKAWAEVRRTEDRRRGAEEWVLAIAGWDQGGHEKELKSLCDELGIEWADARNHKLEDGSPSSVVRRPRSVIFLGPQYGENKAACYRNCDAFILPSLSEGLPMVVLEAWAYGKPVLMTPECNLPEGFAANAAIRIATSADGIAHDLSELSRTPHSALRTFGDNGRALVTERLTWPKIAADMLGVFDWVLGGGPKPNCVV